MPTKELNELREKILGKIVHLPDFNWAEYKISLEDVLICSKFSIHDIISDGVHIWTWCLYKDGKHDLKIMWKLGQPLENQAPDIIKFLNKIL